MRTRSWALPAAVGAVLLLVLAGRTWLVVTTQDAVLGASALAVTGSEVSRAVTAAALLAGAAVVAGLVGSRVVRYIAAVCLLIAGLVALLPVLNVLRDPTGAAEPALTDRTALTGAPRDGGMVQTAALEPAAWLALAGACLVALAGALALLAAIRRPTEPEGAGSVGGAGSGAPAAAEGPGTGADEQAAADGSPIADAESEGRSAARPGAPSDATVSHQDEGQGAQDGTAAWDQLSAGQDPTEENPTGENPTGEDPTDEDDRPPQR